MACNSRFAVAIHLLGMLALAGREPLTSERLARSAGTNPAVVRRLLGALGRARLVRAQVGAGGGTTLARRPEEVTLLEVYRAVAGGPLFGLPRQGADPCCVVGRAVGPVLHESLRRIESAVARELEGQTLADVIRGVRDRMEAPTPDV